MTTEPRSWPLALAYVRVGTEEEAPGPESVAAQRVELTSEAERRGWDIEVVDDDADRSATNLKRPGLVGALQRLDRGDADVLLACRVDRLSRSAADVAGLLERAARRGWQLVVLELDVDTSTPSGEFMVNVKGAFARYEERLLGQRTREFPPCDGDVYVARQHTQPTGEDQPELRAMKIVRWRSGTRHISEDGFTTVCGSVIRPDRARVEPATIDWPAQVNCYNCAYRNTPPGYVSPRSGRDFPLKQECATHPDRGLAEDSCHQCDPSRLRPQNWPCPNGCTDPLDHNPLHPYTRCTVCPERQQPTADVRCHDGCESKELVIRRANPKLSLDLADSAMSTCYHCHGRVCVGCQRAAVETTLELCGMCGC